MMRSLNEISQYERDCLDLNMQCDLAADLLAAREENDLICKRSSEKNCEIANGHTILHMERTAREKAERELATVKESLTIAERDHDDALNNLDDARQALLVIADGRLEVETSEIKRHALREVEIARAIKAGK